MNITSGEANESNEGESDISDAERVLGSMPSFDEHMRANQEFHKAFSINEILDLPDEDSAWQAFIDGRISELISDDAPEEISRMSNDNNGYSGLLTSDTRIVPSGGLNESSFVVDDNQIFFEAIRSLKKYANQYSSRPRHELILRAVQDATARYFGNLTPTPEQEAIRNQKFEGFSDRKTYSISDHKEGALCAERAAVAHDIILFLGEESQYFMGELEEGDKTEDHAFLVTKNDKSNYEIFDPTNPIYCYGDEDLSELQAFLPYRIDTDSMRLPEKGVFAQGDNYVNYRDSFGNKKTKKKNDRKYTIGSSMIAD